MKCVIFGGGGFIGSAIADRLLSDGHHLRIFERPRVTPYRSFSSRENVEWVSGDFTSAHDVSHAVEGADAVLHLVSTTLPKSSNDDPIYDVQTNLVATLQLLVAMRANGVSKIVFISSGGTVYGRPLYVPIDETHPTDPLVSYGITKLAIEKYLLMYERLHGIKAVVLRVSNPYGPRQRVDTAQGAVSAFLSKALNGETIEIWGDGTVVRDYLHVADVADAFAKAATYTGSKTVFNVSSGTGTDLNELVRVIEKVVGVPITRKYLPARAFDVPVSVLSNVLAETELGWAPKRSLSQGIAETVDWFRRV